MAKKKTNATIVDIARKLGVNHSTVSRALADSPLVSTETKIKVNQLAKKMNYVQSPFARGLRTGQTKIIELLYYSAVEHLLEDPILLLVLDSFQHELRMHGYKAMLNIVKNDEEFFQINSMLGKGIADGTILVSSKQIPPSYKHELDPSRCVLLDNAMPGYSSVNFHNDNSFHILIQHLISKGSKKIVGLTMDYKSHYALGIKVSSYNRICRKYQRSLTNLGVTIVKANENPFLKLRKLKEAPDTVVCFTNLLDGMINFAVREGIQIPEDLAIAALIDFETPRGKYQGIPRITLNWKELVRQSILCLLAQLKDKEQPPVLTLVRSPLSTE